MSETTINLEPVTQSRHIALYSESSRGLVIAELEVYGFES